MLAKEEISLVGGDFPGPFVLDVHLALSSLGYGFVLLNQATKTLGELRRGPFGLGAPFRFSFWLIAEGR